LAIGQIRGDLSEGDTVSEACASIGCYFGFYDTRTPHSSLDRQTLDRAYFNRLPQIAAA
jgi:putative transposase